MLQGNGQRRVGERGTPARPGEAPASTRKGADLRGGQVQAGLGDGVNRVLDGAEDSGELPRRRDLADEVPDAVGVTADHRHRLAVRDDGLAAVRAVYQLAALLACPPPARRRAGRAPGEALRLLPLPGAAEGGDDVNGHGLAVQLVPVLV